MQRTPLVQIDKFSAHTSRKILCYPLYSEESDKVKRKTVRRAYSEGRRNRMILFVVTQATIELNIISHFGFSLPMRRCEGSKNKTKKNTTSYLCTWPLMLKCA